MRKHDTIIGYIFEEHRSKSSSSRRKLLVGVGINDSDYITTPKVDGIRICCPYYEKWGSMLTRCYSTKYQEKQPTYIGCVVEEKWHKFSSFKSWMEKQEWEGMQLDKDLKIKGNKIYSENTCLFIPPKINKLLNVRQLHRGKYPLGVTFHKSSKKFRSCINYNGKPKHLGLFDSIEEAFSKYQEERINKISQIINSGEFPKISKYLKQHVI